MAEKLMDLIFLAMGVVVTMAICLSVAFGVVAWFSR
jgi:hypothetical protein